MSSANPYAFGLAKTTMVQPFSHSKGVRHSIFVSTPRHEKQKRRSSKVKGDLLAMVVKIFYYFKYNWMSYKLEATFIISGRGSSDWSCSVFYSSIFYSINFTAGLIGMLFASLRFWWSREGLFGAPCSSRMGGLWAFPGSVCVLTRTMASLCPGLRYAAERPWSSTMLICLNSVVLSVTTSKVLCEQPLMQ